MDAITTNTFGTGVPAYRRPVISRSADYSIRWKTFLLPSGENAITSCFLSLPSPFRDLLLAYRGGETVYTRTRPYCLMYRCRQAHGLHDQITGNRRRQLRSPGYEASMLFFLG